MTAVEDVHRKGVGLRVDVNPQSAGFQEILLQEVAKFAFTAYQ
jgi:hypothetical protein